jgi:hypothetical protein
MGAHSAQRPRGRSAFEVLARQRLSCGLGRGPVRWRAAEPPGLARLVRSTIGGLRRAGDRHLRGDLEGRGRRGGRDPPRIPSIGACIGPRVGRQGAADRGASGSGVSCHRVSAGMVSGRSATPRLPAPLPPDCGDYAALSRHRGARDAIRRGAEPCAPRSCATICAHERWRCSRRSRRPPRAWMSVASCGSGICAWTACRR